MINKDVVTGTIYFAILRSGSKNGIKPNNETYKNIKTDFTSKESFAHVSSNSSKEDPKTLAGLNS